MIEADDLVRWEDIHYETRCANCLAMWGEHFAPKRRRRPDGTLTAKHCLRFVRPKTPVQHLSKQDWHGPRGPECDEYGCTCGKAEKEGE